MESKRDCSHEPGYMESGSSIGIWFYKSKQLKHNGKHCSCHNSGKKLIISMNHQFRSNTLAPETGSQTHGTKYIFFYNPMHHIHYHEPVTIVQLGWGQQGSALPNVCYALVTFCLTKYIFLPSISCMFDSLNMAFLIVQIHHILVIRLQYLVQYMLKYMLWECLI